MRPMRRRLVPFTALLLGALLSGASTRLHAQAAAPPLQSWRIEALRSDEPLVPLASDSTSRSHTGTGLLVGGLVGAAAATVFLVGFCGDPDTACGADEVGRAVVIIGVPPAVVGALIGSLIRTDR